MANERRVRVLNAYGALGAALAAGDTTITFVVAPPLPTVAGTSHIPLIIEPDTAAEEVVYVTAYTAGQLTATIARGKEGTTAVAHAINALWVHGPTTTDFPGPAARIRKSVTTAIATGWNIMTWDYVEFDSGPLWASGSPTKFVAPTQGLYLITGTVAPTLAQPTTQRILTAIWKNGTGPATGGQELGRSDMPGDGAAFPTAPAVAIDYAAAGDFYELHVYGAVAFTAEIASRFQIVRLSG